ncbi:MAG: hypothetical protein ACE5IW_07245 [bacterium]
MNNNNKTLGSRSLFRDIIGADNIRRLDDLIRLNNEFRVDPNIPTLIVSKVLNEELSSKRLIALFNERINGKSEDVVINEISILFNKIPQKLYYFLWSLKNREDVLVEGMITSTELDRAIYCLLKIQTHVELYLKKFPSSVRLYEKLGIAHFDLAGIVRHANRGLAINGKKIYYTNFLRKAISCFQHALKIQAEQGEKIDSSHIDVLRLLDQEFSFKEARHNLYVNPWNFLYISAALRVLNDVESADTYLDKTRFILNTVQDHQNPKVVKQKELLDAVYTLLKYGDSVCFDLNENKLAKLNSRLKNIRMNKDSTRTRSTGYSPIVEIAISEQYRIEYSFIKQGALQCGQVVYLRAIYTLYTEVESASERDKLIYRLNLQPLKIKGRKKSARGFLKAKPVRLLTEQAATNNTGKSKRASIPKSVSVGMGI